MAGEFKDYDRTVRACDDRPGAFIGAVEAVCSPEQITDIEARLFPAPTAQEKLNALEQIKLEALRTGLDDKHPILEAIKAEITATAVEP